MKSYIKGKSVYTYLGEEIRKLGFGLMRLPQKDGVIDVELGAGEKEGGPYKTCWLFLSLHSNRAVGAVKRTPGDRICPASD